DVAQPVDLVFGQVTHTRVRIDVGLGQDLLAGGQADAEDIGQADFNPLFTRDVDAGNARHLLLLALALLVLGVAADNHHHSVATDDLAALTARLDRCGDLHVDVRSLVLYLSLYVIRPRERSYGDSSTRTRSPGRILMKFMRSFPLMWARTRCLFSNSMANMA